MNTQSNAMPDSLGSQQVISAPPSQTRPLYWSIRREFWEYRSLYIAPLAAAGIILVGFLLGAVRLPAKMRAAAVLTPMQQHDLIEQPYTFAALLIMGAAFVVGLFYSVEALHGERRDRSILFWKSLPVSDLTTVLAKASIPIVLLPLLSFVLAVATHWIMLMFSTVVLVVSGLNPSILWAHLSLFQIDLMLLYHLVAVHILWYAPMYAWLLLVSAWARRVPFLWALLPLFAIGVIEKVAFNTSHFGAMLMNRLGGGSASGAMEGGKFSMDTAMQFAAGKFLANPGLWIGLAVTAVFLAGAVRLRRDRGPI